MIRQTSWSILNDRINAIRAKQGRKPVRLNYLSHEGIRLPNGYTVTYGTDEQVKQGASGAKDYFGDTVIVLNAAFQVVWAWDTFDYLDINRQTIPATCTREDKLARSNTSRNSQTDSSTRPRSIGPTRIPSATIRRTATWSSPCAISRGPSKSPTRTEPETVTSSGSSDSAAVSRYRGIPCNGLVFRTA